ncbi:MAG TPA: hypothetical protein QGH10_07860, partial [Armatimonadota bacterium]|nr:hypothetical protein [Armatimonadota bacterium]
SAIACLAVVSRLRAGSTTLKQAALLGLLIGLGAWAKRPTLFVVPIAAWVVFATSPNDRRAAGLACFGLAFLAIAAWWHVYLYFTAGSPFPKFHAEEWDQRSAWELITNDPAIIAWMPVELACHAWVPDWAGAIIPMAVGRLVFAALAVLFVAGIVKAWRSRGEAFLGPLRWTSLVGIGVLVAGIMHYSITVDIRATICGRYLLSGAPWLVCLVAACLPRVKTSGAWHHVRRYLPVVLGAWVLFDVAWWILVQTMYETLGRMVS